MRPDSIFDGISFEAFLVGALAKVKGFVERRREVPTGIRGLSAFSLR